MSLYVTMCPMEEGRNVDSWHQVTGVRNGVGGWRAQGILTREKNRVKPEAAELAPGVGVRKLP